jgi:hypothetical protein
LYLSGFSAGEENAYFAPCWAKPAATALCRSPWSWSIAALLAVSAAPSGYAELGASGVALMNVNQGGTPPPVMLFR